MLPIVAALLDAERQRALVAEELAGRYEEIDLLYAISEILGRTVRLEEAAQIIVREVSAVVGARRASIMVYDEASRTLRTVAARGFAPEGLVPVNVDDGDSVAARVFREQRILTFDPDRRRARSHPSGDDRGYRGSSFISVPICYAAPGTELRCVGVINLTDRIGGDRFTLDDRKLVSAVANQIGAAVENARLVDRDLQQQRLQRELELAHDLQLKLLAFARRASGRCRGGCPMPARRFRGWRLLHFQPTGPGTGGRDAGRRRLARLLRRAGHGVGYVCRRHPRRRFRDAG